MKTWVCTSLVHILGPQQGAARLYAYLKAQSRDVYLKDFNQDAYFTLLSREYLELSLARLNDIMDIESVKLYLLGQKADGIAPTRIKRLRIRG